jgi:pyrroline-5-carboxylate reductase
MAGITLDALTTITGTARVIRAMSSPAAAYQLAFSPWVPGKDTTDADIAMATKVLSAFGAEARVETEDQIDRFTAITGPVPGFVAAFAEAMIQHATRRGIPEDVAGKAIRQLFLSSRTMLSLDEKSPARHVQEMIDYDGTTAAGLRELRKGPMSEAIDAALEAAYQRTKTI